MRSCDWQRARAVNDRYVMTSHVKNSDVVLVKECYSESVVAVIKVL